MIFEEINEDLSLTFRYGWFNSNRFGFVRRAWLANSGPASARIKLLDGLQNLMPCGTGSQFNLEYSTLLDAYKRSELISETGLGLFRLSAIPVDRPEPAEALRATTVWSLGLKRRITLLSSLQLDRFRQGLPLRAGNRRARRTRGIFRPDDDGAAARARPWIGWSWRTSDQGRRRWPPLTGCCARPARLRKLVRADIDRGTRELERIVGAADGLAENRPSAGQRPPLQQHACST